MSGSPKTASTMSGASSASRKILLTTITTTLRLGDFSDRQVFSLWTLFLRFHHLLQVERHRPQLDVAASPRAAPCSECGRCHANSPECEGWEHNGDCDQVEHEAGSRPGSCAGYRPACRRPHARATDHARADPASDGRVDRGHLSAGAQVREGDQSRRSGAPVPHRSALGVEVGYFFEGLGKDNAFKATSQQRLLLELGRNFIAIPTRKHQEAICSLARTLAERDAGH